MSDLNMLNSNYDGSYSDTSVNDSVSHKDSDTVLLLLVANLYISKVFYPLTAILIFIGTILNSLSLYCFIKTNRRNSQNVYLSVLSLVDTINLHINFTLPLLRQIETFDISFRNSTIICRLTGVLTEFFLIFPTWIVVLLTIERLMFSRSTLRRRPSYSQNRAKISIIILAIIVLLLSAYRVVDVKGIDQISVFSVVTCNGTHYPIEIMRNLNLIIWTILPECLTLIISLVIVYRIKLATQKFEKCPSKPCQGRYNQATKTVLLVSILFLIFHTPTGIMIGLNIFYRSAEPTLAVIIILVSRKLTMILYEISLCCKFFIYLQTLNNFRLFIHRPIKRFLRRKDSARLGQPVIKNTNESPQQRVQFSLSKRSMASRTSQSDSYTKSAEDYHNISHHHRHQRTSSTNLSRSNRDNQQLAALMTKTNEESYVTLTRTSDLSRNIKEKRRVSWITNPQITF